MAWSKRDRANLRIGLAFIAPNVAGFLAFTLIPLGLSFAMAFTNWDLRLHSRFKDEPLKFVFLDNFIRLLDWNGNPDFYRYLGNTLFLLMGMPLGIAAALVSALLLSRDLRAGGKAGWAALAGGAGLVLSCGVLAASGAGASGMTVVLFGLFGLILLGGTMGGASIYRTLFYIPNFTAGVATMLLWKKLFDPINGPLNAALGGPLDALGAWTRGAGAAPWQAAAWLGSVGAALLLLGVARRVRRLWDDGELGTAPALLAASLAALPLIVAAGRGWSPHDGMGLLWLAAAGVGVGWLASVLLRGGRAFRCRAAEGMGAALFLGGAAMAAQFALVGLAVAAWTLPAWASDGLQPPQWLQDPSWAKPSLMLMGFWGAVGSQTMLLYLAALTNVPQELYEAAEIDGASRGQKFWNVTWPQLAPTTFFVVIMGMIGGLQGGFEQARVMTNGGPAGATTTLAYYIFNEGFVTGRLGFASAIAWTMFVLVLLVTLFNWKFGNRDVND